MAPELDPAAWTTVGALGTAALGLAAKAVATWFAQRKDRTGNVAQTDANALWNLLTAHIDRQAREIERLEVAHAQCQADHTESIKRIEKLEGLLVDIAGEGMRAKLHQDAAS